MIYLDYNATSPLHPDVLEAMRSVWRRGPLNASSLHGAGQAAKQLLAELREDLTRLLGAERDQVVFTSGATEANNLAVSGLTALRDGPVVISALEHPSVWEPAEAVKASGRELIRLPCDRHGVTLLEPFAELLRQGVRPALVCLMYGSNETGVVQPVRRLVELCRPQGIPVHCDAVQAGGKRRLSFAELGCATLSLSAHKIEGPTGIGALLVQRQVKLQAMLRGGPQQLGLRGGTEPLALIAGLIAALQRWEENREQWTRQLVALRERLEGQLGEKLAKLVVLGRDAERLPHTSNLAFVGCDRQALLIGLDLAGICCSTGSACSSGSSEPSEALLAMGWPREVVDGAIRLSFGPATCFAEVDAVVERILSLVKDLRRLRGVENRRRSGRGQLPDSL